jgi:drug/metabolite transporter (DMT)-like permease
MTQEQAVSKARAMEAKALECAGGLSGGQALPRIRMRGNLSELAAGDGERYLALLFIILCVLFWGFSFISTKVVLSEVPPVTIALLRQIIASATLVPLVLYTRALSRLSPREMGRAALCSFFGMVMYFVLENTGLQYTTASNASMIVSALPAFTLLAEALLFRLKVSWRMVLCLALSMAGVFLVVTVNGRLEISSARLIGNLMVLGAMICWVIYTMMNKKLSEEHSTISIITYQSFAAICIFIPFAIPEADRWRPLSELSVPTLANLLFLGIFCSGLAYIFYIYALRRLGATVSSAFLNLIPVVTAICGYFLLQETLSWIQILGMILIMASLYELNRISPRPGR